MSTWAFISSNFPLWTLNIINNQGEYLGYYSIAYNKQNTYYFFNLKIGRKSESKDDWFTWTVLSMKWRKVHDKSKEQSQLININWITIIWKINKTKTWPINQYFKTRGWKWLLTFLVQPQPNPHNLWLPNVIHSLSPTVWNKYENKYKNKEIVSFSLMYDEENQMCKVYWLFPDPYIYI